MANQENLGQEKIASSSTFESLKAMFANRQFGWKHLLSAATVLGGIGAASRFAARRGKKTVKGIGNAQQKKSKAGRKSSKKST